jgi:hypothetical protein
MKNAERRPQMNQRTKDKQRLLHSQFYILNFTDHYPLTPSH